MIGRLFLLFTIVPALELVLLLQLGAWMGPWPTVLLILVTGALGAAFARAEGFSVLQQLSREAQQGMPPTTRLIEAAMIAAGGLFLITPGVLTDLAGFTLIIPITRRALAPHMPSLLSRVLGVRMVKVDWTAPPRYPAGSPPPSPSPSRGDDSNPFDHPVA